MTNVGRPKGSGVGAQISALARVMESDILPESVKNAARAEFSNIVGRWNLPTGATGVNPLAPAAVQNAQKSVPVPSGK